MATGANLVAGQSTTSENTTELVADAASTTVDFTGGLILKVRPQTGALSPRHNLGGIESVGAQGGAGVSGVGGPENGVGVLGFGGGGPITSVGAGGVGVAGFGGQGSGARAMDPGVGVIGKGGDGDRSGSASALLPSIGVMGFAASALRPPSGSLGVSNGIGVVGLGGSSGTPSTKDGWSNGGPGVLGLAGGGPPKSLGGLDNFGVIGVGNGPDPSGRGRMPQGGTGVVGLGGGVGAVPTIPCAGVVAVGGAPRPRASQSDFVGRFGGPGVVGISGTASAPSALDVSDVGVHATGGYAGVRAIGNNYGIYAATTNPSTSAAGYFEGDVSVARNLWVSGDLTVISKNKSVAIPFSDGSHRRLYCMESPECWFEDFGEARLVKGKAHVKLEREFRGVIAAGSYHVFVTPNGASNGLYVSSRNADGFVVEEQNNGKSSLGFSYRIVGKRKDLDGKRFARVALPKLADRAGTRASRKDAQSKVKAKRRR